MKLSNQKLKILYLMKILLEKTDEEHTLTVKEIIEELDKLGISAERKTIYDDLENLKLFGLDICVCKSKSYGYFIGSREFELPELKLLIDSVQSSKFITKKKSLELISKIEKLTSRENAKKLHRQVFVTNRIKTFNEKIYYNVDKIHDAISENKQITFKYFDLDIEKNKVYRKNGDVYKENPIALTWDDENYYLITYKPKYDGFVHYRVDKMDEIIKTEDLRILPDYDFDLSVYAKRVFSMFGGEEVNVSIKFHNELVGVVFDRFGRDVFLRKYDEEHFLCNVKVVVSPHFLSWIISFGDKAEIISPDFVIKSLYDLVQNVKEIYDKRDKSIGGRNYENKF